ncbi:MAG: hypothetical protein HXY50_17240 [Ignavibacteriaceae bacterium]|nr:hypothetical protein [Ignavibacteriaceae bacterium]
MADRIGTSQNLIPAALVVMVTCVATAPSNAGGGLYAFESLRRPVTSAQIAWGGQHGAAAGGPDALRANPAGLAAETSPSIGMAHQDWMWGLKLDWAGASMGLLGGVCALDVSALHTGAMPSYDADGRERGTFDPAELVGGLGYARSVAPGLRIGASLHLLRLHLPGRPGGGVAFGLGGTYDAGPVTFGVCGRNLGSDCQMEEDRYPLPAEIALGAAMALARHSRLAISLLAEREGEARALAGLRVGGPVGSSLLAGLALRSDRRAEPATLSGGVEIPLGGVLFGYAYVPEQETGAAHGFSVSIAPGNGP